MEETTQGKSPSSSQPNRKSKNDNGFVRFSGLAFELLGIFVVGIGSGYGLDIFFQNGTPFLTLLFSLLSLIGVILYLWKKLPKE